jgi:hypothetical protein
MNKQYRKKFLVSLAVLIALSSGTTGLAAGALSAKSLAQNNAVASNSQTKSGTALIGQEAKSSLVPRATLEKSQKIAQNIETMIKRHRMIRTVGNGAVAALSIYWAGQFFGIWGRGNRAEQRALAPACQACLALVAAPDNRGWGQWVSDGVSSAGSAVISPRWWGRKSYSLAMLLAFTTCHSIMGNNIQELVSKVYYPDGIHWFVLNKTMLRQTVFRLKYYARTLEAQNGAGIGLAELELDTKLASADLAESEREHSKAMLKAMGVALVGEIEKIAGFMLERNKALELDTAITHDMVQLLINNVNSLVDTLNGTGILSDKQIEECYWVTLRTIDGFVGFSGQSSHLKSKSLERYERQVRVNEELAVLPEDIRDTVVDMTRNRKKLEKAEVLA